jgi:hypothetical protein
MVCPSCSLTSFRLSKFRSEDTKQLLRFRYPVRCRGCDQRTHVNLFYALHLLQQRHERHKQRRQQPDNQA